MLVTTYQKDFVAPKTQRYKFLEKTDAANTSPDKKIATTKQCECLPDELKAKQKAMGPCGNTNMEWSGIAPMGRLIEPRILPTKLAPQQVEAMREEDTQDCFKEQPNRFLKILRTAYPDLYERLKQMPKDELSRRMDRNRMFTSYQIDFGNVNEYPEGIYESLQEEDETKKLNESKLLKLQNPCAQFKANVMKELSSNTPAAADPCQQLYKPFKMSFADSSRFINSGNNSHWNTNIFSKTANFTEYMESINKTGCIIMSNKLHDHAKCTGAKHCSHILKHMCPNLK